MSDIDEARGALDLLMDHARCNLDLSENSLTKLETCIRHHLERQRAPEGFDVEFLHHVQAVMTGVLNNCKPIQRQYYSDDREYVGGQRLAELESLRNNLSSMLAAAPEPDDEA